MGYYIIGDEKFTCSFDKAKDYALQNQFDEIYIEGKNNYWKAPDVYGNKWTLLCGSYQGNFIKPKRRFL